MSQNLKEILRNKDLFDPKTVSRPARAELAKDKKFFIEMLESANFPAIKFLVESGADVRVKLAKGMNALGWVLFRDGNVSERQKSVDFLLASGANKYFVCGDHADALSETLHTEKYNNFIYMLSKFDDLSDLIGVGNTLKGKIYGTGNQDVINAFETRVSELENKVGAGPDINDGFEKLGRHAISVTVFSEKGVSLTEVYNFQSFRRHTITRVPEGVDAKVEDFNNVAYALVESAAYALELRGGDPQNWKSHIGLIKAFSGKQVDRLDFPKQNP